MDYTSAVNQIKDVDPSHLMKGCDHVKEEHNKKGMSDAKDFYYSNQMKDGDQMKRLDHTNEDKMNRMYLTNNDHINRLDDTMDDHERRLDHTNDIHIRRLNNINDEQMKRLDHTNDDPMKRLDYTNHIKNLDTKNDDHMKRLDHTNVEHMKRLDHKNDDHMRRLDHTNDELMNFLLELPAEMYLENSSTENVSFSQSYNDVADWSYRCNEPATQNIHYHHLHHQSPDVPLQGIHAVHDDVVPVAGQGVIEFRVKKKRGRKACLLKDDKRKV